MDRRGTAAKVGGFARHPRRAVLVETRKAFDLPPSRREVAGHQALETQYTHGAIHPCRCQ